MNPIDDILERYPLTEERAEEVTDRQIGQWMRYGLVSFGITETRDRCLGKTQDGVQANALGCAVVGAMSSGTRAVDAYCEIRSRHRTCRQPFNGTFACALLLGIAEERAERIARLNADHSAAEIAAALKDGMLYRLEKYAGSASV